MVHAGCQEHVDALRCQRRADAFTSSEHDQVGIALESARKLLFNLDAHVLALLFQVHCLRNVLN